MIKKILPICFLGLAAYYIFTFVIAKEITEPDHVQLHLVKRDVIMVDLMDSFYYIQDIQQKYTANKDTLFLSVRRSTLANIFAKEKLGYKLISIDRHVRTISYCGINKRLEDLPVSTLGLKP